MSDLIQTYNRLPIEFQSGDGIHLYDTTNKCYLDFTSGIGVCNLGYNHPKLNDSLKKQVDLLWHSPNLYDSSLQEEIASNLSDNHQYKAFFCNSGAEANEAAIKLVRKHTQKEKIITFNQSFHGRTFASMTATAQAKVHDGFGSLLSGFHYVPYNDIHALNNVVDHDTAAIMFEVVQGEGGVLPADKEWLKVVQELCEEYGCLLVVDEVQTGIGRTGTFYSYQHYGLQPDIFTLAKGLGNGVPVGAMLAKQDVASSFTPGSHGSTFGGNRLALSVSKEVTRLVSDTEFLQHVSSLGEFALTYLKDQLADAPHVKDVRGLGLMMGIELTQPSDVSTVVSELLEQGLLVLQAESNVVRLLPPLIISKEDLTKGLDLIVKEIKAL